VQNTTHTDGVFDFGRFPTRALGYVLHPAHTICIPEKVLISGGFAHMPNQGRRENQGVAIRHSNQASRKRGFAGLNRDEVPRHPLKPLTESRKARVVLRIAVLSAPLNRTSGKKSSPRVQVQSA